MDRFDSLIHVPRLHLPFLTSVCLFLVGSSLPSAADPTEIENAETVEVTSDQDPFGGSSSSGETIIKAFLANATRNTATVLLRYETYEVPTMISIKLMDEMQEDSERRANLLELVKKGDAKIAESLATRFEAGTSASLENIVEWIYPTEYEPPTGIAADSPLNRPDEELTPVDRQLKVARMFACPNAFDTKNIGMTLEAQINAVSVVEKHWDVALSFSRVQVIKENAWVEEMITMPVFGVTTSVQNLRLEDGQWNLLSSQIKVNDEGKPDPATSHLTLLMVAQVR